MGDIRYAAGIKNPKGDCQQYPVRVQLIQRVLI